MKARPDFPYYSASALDAVMAATNDACECCGAAPGELYRGSFYSVTNIKQLCLECIASGRASDKFDGAFNDVVASFTDGDGNTHIVDAEAAKATEEARVAVACRTPGYESWQGNIWMFHCGDGALFKGDATARAVSEASPEARDHWAKINAPNDWKQVMNGYKPGADLSVYHFTCRHCGLDIFHWDMS